MSADFIRKSAGTLMLLTGIGHVALLGVRPMSPELAITAAFGVGYFLIGLHAAAALFHHYVMRDNTLARMLPAPR